MVKINLCFGVFMLMEVKPNTYPNRCSYGIRLNPYTNTIPNDPVVRYHVDDYNVRFYYVIGDPHYICFLVNKFY
jgi:hypothetical protein